VDIGEVVLKHSLHSDFWSFQPRNHIKCYSNLAENIAE